MTDEQKQQERERIGARITAVRKTVEWTDELGIRRRGMTMAQLGERCGIAASHIARIEKGRYSVGFDTMQSVAHAMGCRIDLIGQ